MSSGIYTITNLVNNKIYVGFANKLYIRKLGHFNSLRTNTHNNAYLQAAFNKYGEANFKFEILIHCLPEHLASEENYWCNLLNTHDRKHGYNIRLTNPNDRWQHAEESKIKMHGIKRIKSPQQIERWKTSIANSDYRMSDTARKKISINNKGLIRNDLRKPVIQLDVKGNVIKEWEYIKQAADALGLHGSNISACCNDKVITSGGFIWRWNNI